MGHRRPLAGRRAAPTPPPTWSACAARCPWSTAWPGKAPSGCGRCCISEDYINALGALTGGQAVEMVKAGLQAIYLSGLAGGGRRQPLRAGLPRPEPLRRQQRSGRRPAHQQRPAAGRPDRVGRERRRGGERPPPLDGPDRGRRRSRLRRRPQRLRAHEGHDRGGRGRGALRGPAVLGEEVRPHGRQGPGSHLPARADPGLGPSGGRRLQRPHPGGGSHRLPRRHAADQRRGRAGPPVLHRRALAGGLLLRAGRHGHRRGPGPGLRPLRRPDLV